MNVRCPVCGAAIALAVGDTRLACAACGLATPVSRVGTAPGALVALERDLKGSELGGRLVLERIGAGGMGTVYRAREADGGEVAIKVLRPGLGSERAVVLARFAREAAALRRLDHPRVVKLLDHGEDGEVAYIVTELVPGRDLAARLAAGRMSLAEIADVFGQVCDGVAAAHAAGIVHRDLKPANILVSDRGAVKVADFGLAQLGPDASITTLTRTDVAMGTFHYLAPEQRKDARNVDHRADVWALGVILYEMLTGELPLGSFAPAGDRRADAIVRRALAPDPAARFASVEELGAAVRALVAPRRTSKVWLAAAAALLFAMGTAGAVAMTAGDDREGNAPSVAASDEKGNPVTAARPVEKASAAVSLDEKSGAPRPTTVALDAAPEPAEDEAPRLGSAAEAKPRPVADQPAGEKAPPTTRRPIGKVSKPAPRKPPPRPDVDAAKAPQPIKGKRKAPEIAAICRQATRCCQVTKGSSCNSFLTVDAAKCSAALAGFRARVTNPKQRDICGGGPSEK